MKSDNYIPVAKLGKPHGTGGAFRFGLLREMKNTRKHPPHFFIEVKGAVLPFFVTRFELTQWDGGIVGFEEVTNPETARQHTGCQLLLTEKEVNTYFKKDAENLHYLTGYKMLDTEGKPIGVITELMELPGQVLAEVEGEGRSYSIPLADDWVVEVNKRKKEITMELPEGLLDI